MAIYIFEGPQLSNGNYLIAKVSKTDGSAVGYGEVSRETHKGGMDSDGNIYVGLSMDSGATTQDFSCYDSNFNQVWTDTIPHYALYFMRVDPDGNMYVLIKEPYEQDGVLFKYETDASGMTLLWSYALSGVDPQRVEAGINGETYVICNETNWIVRKIDTAGNEVTTGNWPVSLATGDGYIRESFIDPYGNLYIGKSRDTSTYPPCLIKISPDGTIVFEAWNYRDIYGIGWSLTDETLIIGDGMKGYLRKVDPSDGSEITDDNWYIDTGCTRTYYPIEGDCDGYIYARTDYHEITKYSPDGSMVWSNTYVIDDFDGSGDTGYVPADFFLSTPGMLSLGDCPPPVVPIRFAGGGDTESFLFGKHALVGAECHYIAVAEGADSYAQGTHGSGTVKIYRKLTDTVYTKCGEITETEDSANISLTGAMFSPGTDGALWDYGTIPPQVGFLAPNRHNEFVGAFSGDAWGDTTQGGRVQNMSFSDDKEWFVGHYYDIYQHPPKILRFENGAYVDLFSTPGVLSTSYYSRAAISPDGEYLCVTTNYKGSYDESPYIWMYQNNRDDTFSQMTVNLGSEDFYNSYGLTIDWSPDSSLVVIGTHALHYNTANAEWEVLEMLVKDKRYKATWKSDGSYLATPYEDYIRLYSVSGTTFTHVEYMKEFDGGYTGPVTAVAWSTCGKYLFIGADALYMFEHNETDDSFSRVYDTDWSDINPDIASISVSTIIATSPSIEENIGHFEETSEISLVSAFSHDIYPFYESETLQMTESAYVGHFVLNSQINGFPPTKAYQASISSFENFKQFLQSQTTLGNSFIWEFLEGIGYFQKYNLISQLGWFSQDKQKILSMLSRGDHIEEKQNFTIGLLSEIKYAQALPVLFSGSLDVMQNISLLLSNDVFFIAQKQLSALEQTTNFYSLQKINQMLSEIQAQRVATSTHIYIDGKTINQGRVGNTTITYDEANVHNEITIQCNDPDVWDWANPDFQYGEPRLEVHCGSRLMYFIIETREGEKSDFTITGISVSIKEDAPFASDIDFQLETPALASEIAASLTEYCAVDWDVEDWVVPVEFNFSGKPLDGIQQLANEVGAIVRCQDDGSLLVRRRRPVRPVHMNNAQSSVNYDRSNVISLAHSEEKETGYNAVQVLGKTADVFVPSLSVENRPAIGEKCIIRVFWKGNPATVIDEYVTDGKISIVGSGAFYTEDIEEIVEFKDHKATVDSPIYELLGYEWIGDSGGSVDYIQFEKDLSLETERYRVAKVKYRTRFQKYELYDHYVEQLIAVLFLDSDPDVLVNVRTEADPAYGPQISAPLLATNAAAVERGKSWIDQQYRKSRITVSAPYDDNALDGELAYVNDAEIGEQGNYHIVSSSIVMEGPKITNQLEFEKCLIFFNT